MRSSTGGCTLTYRINNQEESTSGHSGGSVGNPIVLAESGHSAVDELRTGHVLGQCASPDRQPQLTGQKYDKGFVDQKTPFSTQGLMPQIIEGFENCPPAMSSSQRLGSVSQLQPCVRSA